MANKSLKSAVETDSPTKPSEGPKIDNGTLVEEYHGLILPSLQELEIYEQKFPGSAQKILEMGKLEQRYRHRLQDKFATSYNLTYRLGQLFGLIYSLVTLMVIVHLALINRERLAMILLSVNLAIIALGIITSNNTRRKPHLRRWHRKNAGLFKLYDN